MLAELPTHLGDPRERLARMRDSMLEAKRAFEAVPASLLQDLSTLVPTALSGLAARALFRLATVPGLMFNLFVSNVPGPQLPLYIAGARVEGIYPVSAVTDLTGGLNITLFSYDGSPGLRADRLPRDGPGRVAPDRLPPGRDGRDARASVEPRTGPSLPARRRRSKCRPA